MSMHFFISLLLYAIIVVVDYIPIIKQPGQGQRRNTKLIATYGILLGFSYLLRLMMDFNWMPPSPTQGIMSAYIQAVRSFGIL